MSDARYRALLGVLLARADERTSTALELARRAQSLHPESALARALCTQLEAELELPGAAR